MCWNVRVSLFIPLIFLHIMKIITSYNDGSHHLGAVAGTSKYTPPNRNSAGEWTLLVNIGSCSRNTLQS